MTASQLTVAYCVGGAILGFWAVIRFPQLAPRTLRGALGALVVAMAVMALVPTLLAMMLEGGGRVVGLIALLTLVLPTLTAVFWAGGCVLRVFQRMLTGQT